MSNGRGNGLEPELRRPVAPYHAASPRRVPSQSLASRPQSCQPFQQADEGVPYSLTVSASPPRQSPQQLRKSSFDRDPGARRPAASVTTDSSSWESRRASLPRTPAFDSSFAPMSHRARDDWGPLPPGDSAPVAHSRIGVLKQSLTELGAFSTSTALRLDHAYYGVLEKISALDATVATLRDFAELSREIPVNFDRDVHDLTGDFQGKLDSLACFQDKRDRIKALQDRLDGLRGCVGGLTDRVEAVHERVKGWERADRAWQQRWRWRMCLLWFILVVAVAFVVRALLAIPRPATQVMNPEKTDLAPSMDVGLSPSLDGGLLPSTNADLLLFTDTSLPWIDPVAEDTTETGTFTSYPSRISFNAAALTKEVSSDNTPHGRHLPARYNMVRPEIDGRLRVFDEL